MPHVIYRKWIEQRYAVDLEPYLDAAYTIGQSTPDRWRQTEDEWLSSRLGEMFPNLPPYFSRGLLNAPLVRTLPNDDMFAYPVFMVRHDKRRFYVRDRFARGGAWTWAPQAKRWRNRDGLGIGAWKKALLGTGVKL